MFQTCEYVCLITVGYLSVHPRHIYAHLERMCVFNIFCVCVCVCFQVVCDMIVCVCVYDVMKPSTGPDLPQKHIALGAPRTLHMCTPPWSDSGLYHCL